MTLITRPGYLWNETIWNPSMISTALWFDASDSSTITQSSNAVSQWDDKSGNSRNIAQTAPSQQPTFQSNTLNGKAVITFDGSNDILSNASVGANGINNVTIISVFKMIGGGASQDLPMGIGSTGNSFKVRSMFRASGGTTVGFAGWTPDITSSAYSYDINGSYHIFVTFNSALSGSNNVTIGRDGSISTYSSSSSFQGTVDGFSVGSLQGTVVGNYYSNISVAEIIVLYTDPTTITRQKIEGYLAHKWGIDGSLPNDHPYKTTGPTP